MASHPLQHQVVCVDGPSASGKGTLAKELARLYRLKFLDTGCLYRAVAHRMLALGLDPADPVAAADTARLLATPGMFDFKHTGNNRFAVLLEGVDVTEAIRGSGVGQAASVVAAQPPVRAALLDLQKSFVAQWAPVYGVVLDGRDTAVRIAPEAGLKIFLTASVEARAQRRAAEFAAAGRPLDVAQVAADLAARDARDAPNTLQAQDAQVIDASGLDIGGVAAAAQALVAARFGVSPVI